MSSLVNNPGIEAAIPIATASVGQDGARFERGKGC
jgi:hypothetical protein